MDAWDFMRGFGCSLNLCLHCSGACATNLLEPDRKRLNADGVMVKTFGKVVGKRWFDRL